MARKAKEAAAKPNVSPDDEAACYAELSDLNGQIARIQQSKAVMLDRYKKLGVDTAAIKHAYALYQKDDPTGIHKSRTALLMRLGIIEFDEEGQGSFLGGLSVEKPSPGARRKLELGRANSDGYNSGLAGALKDSSRYHAGTEEHVAWLEGWDLGHGDRVKAGKGDIVKAEPRKRAANGNGEAHA